jgi:putative addiction module killer protein
MGLICIAGVSGGAFFSSRISSRSNFSTQQNTEAAVLCRPRHALSKVKDVGSGVFEHKIDFGPGYRIYFGKDGDRLVVLIGGGTKCP